MSPRLRIAQAGPLATIQDRGRPGLRAHGISASGPMDRQGYERAGALLGHAGSAIEFTSQGLTLSTESGRCRFGAAGGTFRLRHNGSTRDWPATGSLEPGDILEIATGPSGNFGYIRFDHEIDVPVVLGSRSTNVTVGLGGFGGRALRANDDLDLIAAELETIARVPASSPAEGPIRFVWGLHAGLFPHTVREAFCRRAFTVSSRMDRMGMRLEDPSAVFGGASDLSLVSDAIVPGDIQVLGDGTPTVLMRDHQPSGGYPRIATVISSDCDRIAQARPGQSLLFQPVTVDAAHRIAQRGAT